MSKDTPNTNPDPKASSQFREDLSLATIAARDLAKDLKYVRESLLDSAKQLSKIAALNKDYVGASKKLAAFAKDSVALSKDLSALYDSELQTKANQVLKQTMLNTGLRGEYAQTLATAVLEGKMNEKQLAAMKEELKARQHITEQVEKSTELIEAMARWQDELHEELDGYSMGWEKLKSKIETIVTNPKLAKTVFAVEGMKTLNEGMKKFGEGFEKLRERGLSAGQAVEGQIKSISMLSVLGLSDTQGVLDGMIDSYGNINALSSEQVDHMGHLAHEMGIAGTEAFKLQAGLSEMPGETLQTAEHAMEYANEMAKVNGLAPGKIAGDMAKNTQAMATFANGGAKGFAKAAVEAHKMGIDIATSVKMSEGLLDFENSINKQLEASVLLGREINLDKARELALQGKSVEAAREVLKNIGGQAEFEKMNVVQKKALADAAGMTVEELSKAADAQQEYNKYHGEEVSWWKKKLGFVMETGGKVGGFLKENGLLLLSGLSVMKQYGGGLNLVKGAMGKIGGLFGGGGMSMDQKRAMVLKRQAADKAGMLAEKAKGADDKKGAGVGGFMKGLAEGLKAFGEKAKDILVGAVVFAASAALLGLALAAVALGYQAMGGKPETLIGLGVALAGFALSAAIIGKLSSQIMQGALAMLVLGASLIPAAFAFSLLQGVSTDTIIAFSIALPLLGLAAAGLGLLIIPIGLGAIALASLGVGMIAVSAGLLLLQTASGGVTVFDSLTKVAANAAGLYGVGGALIMIAGGLSAIAFAGTAALPALAMLTGLGAVAGSLFGGDSSKDKKGSGSGEEDPVIKAITKLGNDIKQMKIILKLDTKVLAEGTALGTNRSPGS